MLAAESLKTAEQAVRSAEADLKRAESVRAAGMSTDVDVLSIRVHLAAVTEQRIQRAADLDVAQAALNDALGLPLDTPHTLTTPLDPLDLPDLDAGGPGEGRLRQRGRKPAQTHLAATLAQTQADSARSALLPQVGFHAAFEADRQRFVNRGGANWLASIGLRWNLFNGFARQGAHRGIQPLAGPRPGRRAARRIPPCASRCAAPGPICAPPQQRIEVAKAAVAEAEESLRITQNRYEAGMSNVTDLLRNETAVLESRTRYLAAVHDQRIAATMLELAAGRSTPDSEVLN